MDYSVIVPRKGKHALHHYHPQKITEPTVEVPGPSPSPTTSNEVPLPTPNIPEPSPNEVPLTNEVGPVNEVVPEDSTKDYVLKKDVLDILDTGDFGTNVNGDVMNDDEIFSALGDLQETELPPIATDAEISALLKERDLLSVEIFPFVNTVDIFERSISKECILHVQAIVSSEEKSFFYKGLITISKGKIRKCSEDLHSREFLWVVSENKVIFRFNSIGTFFGKYTVIDTSV